MGILQAYSRVAAALLLLVCAATIASAQTVTATWDRNSDSYTAGYRLYYGTASGSYQWSIDAGNQVSAPVTLSPGNVYYLAVRAYNAQNSYGPASAETTVDLRTAPPPPPPAPTAQITSTLGANNQATLTWRTSNATSATINGGAVALSGTTTITVNVETSFTLVAKNAAGQIATATTIVKPAATTPAPTAQISSTLGANNQATLTWRTGNATSATINGSTVALSGTTTITVSVETSFTLVAKNAAGQTASATTIVKPAATTAAPTAQISSQMGANNLATLTWRTSNATSATINGGPAALSGTVNRTVNVETSFTLVAKNAAGQTASAVTIVTPAAPGAPTAQIAATMGANNVATVTWQTSNATSATINGVGTALAGSSNVTVTGDTTFTLVARNAAGQTATARASVTTTSPVPGTPTSVAASVAGTRVTLSWRPPTTGAAPTSYVVDVGTTSGASDIVQNTDVGNVLTASGDIGKGTYYARVRAANGSGVSASSNEVRFSVGRKLRTPSSLAVNWTGTTATLSWAAPSADGVDEAATSYVVEAGTAPGSSDVGSLNVGNTTTFQANVPFGTYYVRVRALNAVGESDPSDEVEVRTPGAPQAPTGLVSNNVSGAVTLSWSAPSGGRPPSGYVIEAGSAPGLTDLASLNVGNITSFTTNAPPGVYYVRVRAANDRGTSAASNEVVVRR